eukprot:6755071-Lingulodinium_polyedra.AAC.1
MPLPLPSPLPSLLCPLPATPFVLRYQNPGHRRAGRKGNIERGQDCEPDDPGHYAVDANEYA